MNPELDKRKELERRKKLRLLQVRQQSKEFADKLREKIKGELDNQREKYLKAENKLKQEKHLQELCQLKELYDKCLKSIGEGHKEAAKQLDLNLKKQAELAEISAKAVERGAKALKKHKEEEAIQKHKTELPVKQKRATRNKENLRAFYISSLPKHAENNGPLSVSPSKPTNQDPGLQETRRVLEEIPTNVTGCETKLSNVQKQSSPEKRNELRKDLNAEEKVQSRKQSLPEVGVSVTKPEEHLSNTSSARDCSCEYIVCACHRSPGELRRCSSESRISCEKVRDFEEPIRKKVRNRSFSPRSVRTLNYFDGGNVYESNQQSNVRVTHHSSSPKRTEEEPVLNTASERPVSKPSADELKKRTDERSAKSLRKEQLKKDFQQLIQNFKKLTREKSVISSKTKGKLRVYSSERDILERNESKQKKLNDAFEKLPHSVKSSKTISAGIQKTAQIQTDDSSPPTLNLAVCQTNMIRKVVSTDEISISSTPTTHRGNKRARSTHSSPRSTQQQSSTTYDKSPPNVVVKKDPSGDVHITVKVSEVLGGKSKSSSPSSGSSYLSPPSAITPSQQRLLDDLLRQVNKGTIGCELKKYIKELLSMSRESVEALRGGRTNNGPPFTPGGGSQSPLIDQDLEQDFAKLNQLAEVYAEKVNTLVNMYEQMSSSPSTPPYIDPVRAPPSITTPSPQFVSPRSMMSPSPQPRQGVCPSPATVPQSRQVICPSPADVPQSQQVICPSPANVQCLPQPQQGICPDPCVPPSRTLSSQRVAPRSTRSPSPQPRQGICPAATPSPRSSGSSGSSELNELLFGGIPGVAVPTREEFAANAARAACLPPVASPIPEGWDMEAFFWEKYNQLGLGREEPSRKSPSHACGTNGDALGKQEDSVKIDTSLDLSALKFPLNPVKLNEVRQKLAAICNDQYRRILEDLQTVTNNDQRELEHILQLATSDPGT